MYKQKNNLFDKYLIDLNDYYLLELSNKSGNSNGRIIIIRILFSLYFGKNNNCNYYTHRNLLQFCERKIRSRNYKI